MVTGATATARDLGAEGQQSSSAPKARFGLTHSAVVRRSQGLLLLVPQRTRATAARSDRSVARWGPDLEEVAHENAESAHK
jgi:hypothetical protein